MKDPYWLTQETILMVHGELLSRFGGVEGIRDEGLLSSALARPQQLAHYENPSHFEIAASYTYGLVKNHPFIDGNKRIGFMAAYIFLEINGYSFQATEEAAVIMTRDLAAGDLSEDAYAKWLEDTCKKR